MGGDAGEAGSGREMADPRPEEEHEDDEHPDRRNAADDEEQTRRIHLALRFFVFDRIHPRSSVSSSQRVTRIYTAELRDLVSNAG